MFYINSMLAVVPTTLEWNINVGLTMILCNIVAIAIGKFTMKDYSAGPKLPGDNLFGGMGFSCTSSYY